ncbi:uncharacterized protein J8A68_005777 [[Candida] subhashii]|uniref:Opaque-phase-specific protein OP4 n=1 Tax=[Candida] subhashii TaxID=561895 RepID=A0A8J5QFI1_9ASCO|nr:uncharacterized protein J8A68_005777 [[Candida] subhashii]KAG7660660.1 hypothetical protein J8A68_005777 [[Candida] subhashii]
MKLTNATLLAIVASSAFVSAAPINVPVGNELMVKRSDANEVLEILNELNTLKAKREYIEGEDALLDLQRREDSAIGQLITALINSGIIGDVYSKLTTDPQISASVKAIVKAAIQTAVVQGPALIKAVWNSGMLGDIFNKFLNDTDLRTALLNVAKSLFGTAVNLLKSYASGASSSSSSSTTSSKRDVAPVVARRSTVDADLDEYLDKRDVADIVAYVAKAIYSSGLVQNFVSKIMANPQQSIDFMTTAFKTGLAVSEEVYSWAKSNGLWDASLKYISENAGTWASRIASVLGPMISGGSVSASDIDNASATTAAATKTAIATTTASTVVATTTATASSNAAIDYVDSLAAQKRQLY